MTPPHPAGHDGGLADATVDDRPGPAGPGSVDRPVALERAGWSSLLRGPGGFVRALGLACVVVAAVRGPVDVALFSLVLAGLVVPVLGRVRPWLDAAYGVGLLAAAWSGVLDLYEAVAGLDLVMHLVVTGLVAAVTHLFLARRTRALVDPTLPAPAATRIGSVVLTTSLGLWLSVAWEFGEYLGNTYIDPEIYVGYADTIGDLAMGAVGSAVAGALLLRGARRSRGQAVDPSHQASTLAP